MRSMVPGQQTAVLLRRGLLLILLFSIVGTGVELLLLRHTEGVWQLAPLLLIALTMIVLAWYGVARSATSIRALQGVMLLCLVSGVVGFVQHFSGNLTYARDSNPSLTGMDLYKEALSGSTPSLAPGTMIQVALLGLAFAFRHPSLRGADDEDGVPTQRNLP
jgi:hypothetical protein